MSSKTDRTPTPVQAAAAVSLVALVACALATDAHASRLPVEPGVAVGRRVAVAEAEEEDGLGEFDAALGVPHPARIKRAKRASA